MNNKGFEFLKKEFPTTYRDIVLSHKAVNKVITFCDDNNQYLLFTGMFHEVNNAKGITGDLEIYLVNFLANKYNSKAFGRASAYVEENQTTFIGYDIRGAENQVWSQKNIFNVDDDDKVISVAKDFESSSDKNNIYPSVSSYFKEIDFPEDTKNYLNNLYKQVKPSLEIIKLER